MLPYLYIKDTDTVFIYDVLNDKGLVSVVNEQTVLDEWVVK